LKTIESKFVANKNQRILKALEIKDMTAKDLSESLDTNYSSIRKALQYLLEQGLVTTKPGQLRNAEWSISKHITSNQIIPRLTTLIGEIRLDDLMSQYTVTNSNAARAVVVLPRHIVRIFAHAKRLAEGQTTTVGLDLIRKDMEKDVEFLRQVTNIYEQILRYPRIWDEALLAKFPEDIDFDQELFDKAFSHYFKEDSDA
jgi:DNA-binding transcriptional ArsR family regulator